MIWVRGQGEFGKSEIGITVNYGNRNYGDSALNCVIAALFWKVGKMATHRIKCTVTVIRIKCTVTVIRDNGSPTGAPPINRTPHGKPVRLDGTA